MEDWRDKEIVVSGGAGFIGSHVVDRLVEDRGADPDRIRVPRSSEHDLRYREPCEAIVEGADIVLHLAADIGGVGYSSEHPAEQYYNIMAMDVNLVEAAHQAAVDKFVSVSSACAYPRDAPNPLSEENLFDGKPQETNRAYGFAKRMMVPQAEAYRKQYGMDIAVVVAANAYGPRDDFDLETSHVIPALIRKCLEGPEDELVVWGDGTPTRDFLYVEDFAEGVLLAAENLDTPEPANIGTGTETSIRELVDVITELTDFPGEITYDTSKPAGQPRRVIDISRARKRMGFEPRIDLEEGVRRTIDWWRQEGSS